MADSISAAEIAQLQSTYGGAAQQAVSLVREAMGDGVATATAEALGALEATLAEVEGGLAADGAVARAKITEAVHFLLPLCALLQPGLAAPAAQPESV